MNGYIINPAWFYWVSIADAVKAVLFVLAIVALILAGIAIFIFVIDGGDCFDNEKIREQYKKAVGRGFIIGVLCLIAAILIPSKETLVEMQVAKYATWENAEWTVDALKEAVDYIVNAIGSLK